MDWKDVLEPGWLATLTVLTFLLAGIVWAAEGVLTRLVRLFRRR